MLLARSTSTNYSIIDIADKSGDTALHYGLRFRRKRDEILPLLLDNGANIDRKNVHGQAVVDIARDLGWEHGVTLLTSAARARNPQITAYEGLCQPDYGAVDIGISACGYDQLCGVFFLRTCLASYAGHGYQYGIQC